MNNNSTELKDLKTYKAPILKKVESTTNINDMLDTFDYLNREMESSDFFMRMISMILSIEEDKQFDFDPEFNIKAKSYLPWNDDNYNNKSPFELYTHKNVPEWVNLKELSIYIINILDITTMRVKIRKYAPNVFHHLRKIDEISVTDCIASLDPIKNQKNIIDSFASGGRSANPIIFTHDKKFLLKTISKEEKNIFVKMLPEYHRRMRDTKSYLCRIYGVFRIKVGDKQDTHIIIMKNMNELPSDVYTYYNFRLKYLLSI